MQSAREYMGSFAASPTAATASGDANAAHAAGAPAAAAAAAAVGAENKEQAAPAAGVMEYEHDAVKIIRATIDEEAEPKRLLTEKEQAMQVARAYIQPSLIAPNSIKIVELTEDEKKQRAAETVELTSLTSLGGAFKEMAADFDVFKKKEEKKLDPVALEKYVRARCTALCVCTAR